GIIGNDLHMPSRSIHRAVNVRRSAGPNKKAPPFGGTLSPSLEEMRYAKLSAPDWGAVAADQASGRRAAAADPASAGLGSAGPGSGSAGQDSGSDCSFQFSFLLRRGLTPSAKRGCARLRGNTRFLWASRGDGLSRFWRAELARGQQTLCKR